MSKRDDKDDKLERDDKTARADKSERDKKPRIVTVRAYIDAIEEDVARLLIEDRDGEWRAHHLPAAILPAAARENSWLELSVKSIAPPDGQATPKLREKLGRGDRGGDIVL